MSVQNPQYASDIEISKIDVEIVIRDIDGQTIHDLKESIKLYGIIQPLIVCQNPNGARFTLICGRHRLIAAKGLGLKTVPVLIRPWTQKKEILFISLQENIQRLEMDPVKEGEIYSNLLSEGYNLNELSEKLGKTRYYIETRSKIFKNLHDELKPKIGKILTISNAINLSRHPKATQIEIYNDILKQVTQKPIIKGWNAGGWNAPSKFCKCDKCGSKHLKGVSVE